MQRASHALVADGKVWFVDPVEVDDIVDRGAALGEPAGVLQLLDRHNRDCEARRRAARGPAPKVPDEVAGSPFEAIAAVRVPGWKETALWWPEHRGPGRRRGRRHEQPLQRRRAAASACTRCCGALPPGKLRGYEPEHLLAGHGAAGPRPRGEPRASSAPTHRSRRDLPRALLNLPAAR